MNTSAATATLPGGVRAKEISSALYQPQHMPSTKINCQASRGKANSNSQGVTRIGQRCQQPYISSEAPSKG